MQNAWPITTAQADLVASAYLLLVDRSADPQDVGLALLTDSLQGFQVREGRKLPREWQTVEAYRFAPATTDGPRAELEDTMALLSDTARAHPRWDETDSYSRLQKLRERLNGTLPQ